MELKDLEELEELTASVSKEHNREVYGRYNSECAAVDEYIYMRAEEEGLSISIPHFLNGYVDYDSFFNDALCSNDIVQVCTSKNVFYIVLRSNKY